MHILKNNSIKRIKKFLIKKVVSSDIATATRDNYRWYPNTKIAPMYDPAGLKLLLLRQMSAPPI